jgi:hypothetical protein
MIFVNLWHTQLKLIYEKKHFILYNFLFIFTVCIKDSSGGTNNGGDALSGTWKFTSLTSQSEATAEYNLGGDDFRDVTDNAGTISFSGGTATSTAISYSVDTTVYVASYEDNVFIENDSTPLSVTVPSSSSVATYKIIGTDSVFFANGFVTSTDLTGGGPQAATPIGYKFHINGNILTMTSAIVRDTTEDFGGGVLAQVHQAANLNISLTKQ